MAKIDPLLELAIQKNASDVHVGSFSDCYLRINGKLLPLSAEEIPEEFRVEDKTEVLLEILSEEQRMQFEKDLSLDFSYILRLDKPWRARVNYYRQNRGGCDAVFRIVPPDIPTLKDLGFPVSVIQMLQTKQGILFVTGPRGSGKTTTLAAMVDELNRNTTDHIITVEDPIEYVHKNKSCIVTQRELGSHTDTFSNTLRAALREDPDVIVIGEMRDLDTISMALTCAETGHLVLGTLNTNDAASTIDRVINVFPPNSQEQVRVMISDSLRGIISQQLVPMKEQDARCIALEILVGSPALSSMIREKKTFNLMSYMQTGKVKFGMEIMDDSLLDLFRKNLISWETALLYSHDSLALEVAKGET